MSITMEELGRKLGLSRQTISLVVHDHPSVKPETRRKVQQAMKRYGYRPNLLARSLAQNRRNALGIVNAAGRRDAF